MTRNQNFFERCQPRAVFKHGLLARYAYYFASRGGSYDRPVLLIDGYAGPGRYEDGAPGSPLLLASQAERAKLLKRNVELVCVEKDEEHATRLGHALRAEFAGSPARVECSPVDDVLLDLVRRNAEKSILVFIDPFGLGLQRTLLEALLQEQQCHLIDVIYHSSVRALYRNGPAAMTGYEWSEVHARKLDGISGDHPWRSYFTGEAPPGIVASRLATDFADALVEGSRIRVTPIPVFGTRNADVRQGDLGSAIPDYLLMLFSKNVKAH